MKQNSMPLPRLRKSTYLIGLALLGAGTANADSDTAAAPSWQEASGVMEATGYNPNDWGFFKRNNLKFSGWLETSISGNDNAYHDGFNGPVTFQDRNGDLQLNQLNFFFQKMVTTSGDQFDWGGRADFMFGSDSIFTQAYGNPTYNPHTGMAQPRGDWDLKLTGDRFYGIALPNAYAEFNLPFGEGLNLKAGHFYTPIGYEVVTSPDNFFVTKPYTFQYGEPFTHTGLLGSYTFNPTWQVMAGAVTGSGTGGWDGSFNRNLGTWSGLYGVTWTSDDANTSLFVSGTAGKQSDNNGHFWGDVSLVGKHNVTDKLHLILQHDHGWANSVITGNGLAAPNNGSPLQNADWYGVNGYIVYDVTDKLGAGIRAEWFRDNNGFRVAGPGRCAAAANATSDGTPYNYACGGSYSSYPFAGSSYEEVTLGMTYKALKWLTLRPNIRWDHADIKAFAGGNQNEQVMITGDAVVLF